MATIGGPRHEKALKDLCDKLRSEGYIVVALDGKSPDAVACKDGKMIAVEVLSRYGKENKYKLTNGTFASKRRLYEGLGFASVLFEVASLDRDEAKVNGSGWFGKANKILGDR